MKHFAAAFLIAVAGWLPADAGPAAAAMPIREVAGASGVAAWLVEDHSLPVVTLRFAFRGGAALDAAGKGCTASMAAGLLDEGAGPYDTVEFHRRLDDLAAQLSFSVGQDEFSGSLRSLKPRLAEAAELLRVSLADPHFDGEAVERIRADTMAALARQARNPRSLSNRLWLLDAFEQHPYGRNGEGSETSVKAIQRDDLATFAASHFRRDGLVVGIVGDVTEAEAAALLDRVFGDLPRGGGDRDVPEAKPLDDGALVVTRIPVPQSVVTFGQAGPKRSDPDWYAAFILNDIIGGGGFRGRLMKEIREKRGLAYGVSTALWPYRHAGLIVGNVATENSRVAETIALIRAEWQRMHDEGPAPDEVEAAKTYLTGAFPLSLDSTSRVAGLLVQMQLDGLGIDYLDRRAGLIGAVPFEEMRQVARRLFDPARLSFAVVGDPGNLEPTRPPRKPGF